MNVKLKFELEIPWPGPCPSNCSGGCEVCDPEDLTSQAIVMLMATHGHPVQCYKKYESIGEDDDDYPLREWVDDSGPCWDWSQFDYRITDMRKT